ncbi:MAG: TetR/AcrR family transcriptional regulator [Actinomycetota bacterium]
MARPTGRDIRSEVMAEARIAMQASGVAGFSYGDLARRLGVRAPSIHHHVGRKDDLVASTTRAYRAEFRARVETIEAVDPIDRLRTYVGMFLEPADDDLLCLCGAVATDWADVGDAARAEVEAFLTDELAWLTSEVDRGVQSGALRSDLDPAAFARALVAALEGALVLERTSAGGGVAESMTTLIDLAAAPA